MKTTTKLSLVAGAVASFATAVAFADDPQLQNRLDLQRNQAASNRPAATVAVYAERHSPRETTVAFSERGRPIGRTERGAERWRQVSTPQGGTIDYVAPAQ